MSNASEQRTLRSRLVWPGMVFWLIGMSLTIGFTTLTLAIVTSQAVEDDYYAKAIGWDEIAAERRASESLGWTAEVSLAEELDPVGRRSVMVTVVDTDGEPVDATAGDFYTFHHADRGDSFEFPVVRIAPGRWSGAAPMTRDGLWQVRMRFELGGDVFIPVVDVETGAG
ncbi:MAG: FixH family protein [Planctomycetota bacterium]